jgi:hypothetical protein
MNAIPTGTGSIYKQWLIELKRLGPCEQQMHERSNIILLSSIPSPQHLHMIRTLEPWRESAQLCLSHIIRHQDARPAHLHSMPVTNQIREASASEQDSQPNHSTYDHQTTNCNIVIISSTSARHCRRGRRWPGTRCDRRNPVMVWSIPSRCWGVTELVRG